MMSYDDTALHSMQATGSSFSLSLLQESESFIIKSKSLSLKLSHIPSHTSILKLVNRLNWKIIQMNKHRVFIKSANKELVK